MKRNAMLCAAVTAALLSLYGCSTSPDPVPFDPAKMQQNSRETARYLPNREYQPIPTTLNTQYSPRESGKRPTTEPATSLSNGPSLSEDPILRLSLQEAIHRAVNNNMDIRVAGYEPAVNSNRVVEAESQFDPTVFANPFYQWTNPADTTSTPTLAQPVATQVWGVSAGIRQNLQNGGTAELRWEPSQYWNPQSTTTPDPTTGASSSAPNFWNDNLVLDLKQPLLKNFGADVNMARIVIAKNDQRISLLDYRKKVEDTLFTVEQTYWQLQDAEQEVRIAEELLQRTIYTAELLAKRGAEDVTRIQTSQAASAIETRRVVLIEARNKVREFSDRIKQLMNDPELPVASNTLILAATDPLQSAVKFDWQDQINQAMEHRLDLAQQILRIESASTITKVAKNNTLPALSLVQTITSNGAAVAFDSAFSDMNGFDHMTYRAGLQFEIPIGNRQAEAIYQRTLLQRQQAIDQYRAFVDQTSLEVKAALRNMQTAWEEMSANRQAVLLTADTLDKINARMRESEEAYTPTFVQLRLDTQARLAEAQRGEAQSIANYSISIAALEKAKGTLLRYDNVLMEEDLLRAVSRGKTLAKVPPLAPVATQPASINESR